MPQVCRRDVFSRFYTLFFNNTILSAIFDYGRILNIEYERINTDFYCLRKFWGFCPADDVSDHLGSVRAVVDGDTGTVIETNDYYPFGKRIPTPAAKSAAVFGSVSVTKPAGVTADPNPHSVASTSSVTVVTATTAIRLRSRATLKSTFRDFRNC